MTISKQYNPIILKQVISDLLTAGGNPTALDVLTAYNNTLISLNTNTPQFKATDGEVSKFAHSSVELYNKTNQSIKDDLTALYRDSLDVGNDVMLSFDRWRTSFDNLTAQLTKLNDRVTNLLLISKDTTGYFNFISDTFSDTSKVDIDNSSCLIDLGRKYASITTSSKQPTQILISDLGDDQATFTVLTNRNVQSSIDAEGSKVKNSFLPTTKFWQTRVYSTVPQPIVGELKVDLGESTRISRITFHCHASNTSSSLQVTPMLSTDGINYIQLPSDVISLSIIDRGTFVFKPTDCQYIKFILAKSGFDNIDTTLYVYEFGANNIQFFSEGFIIGSDNLQQLITNPLSIKDSDGSLASFNSVALEVCERVPTGSTIDYFVAASNEVVAVSGLNWVAIDPLTRATPVDPTVINFNDLTEFEYGNSTSSGNWIKLSYDAGTANSHLVNPGAFFKLVDIDPTSVVTPATASDTRYILPSIKDMILNYQFTTESNIEIDKTIVFRNLGLKGDTTQVRGIQAGWGFSDPYYSTTIEILTSTGASFNFGDKQVIIDGIAQNGNVQLSTGIHTVKVHKSNWIPVGAFSPHDLDTLKLNDPLYPFNHKLIIEGYSYPNDFSGEQIYLGVDLFAETKCLQISPFDLLRSLIDTDLSKFAIDLDAQDGARSPSYVIIVKSDSKNPDFTNERFVARVHVNSGTLDLKYIWLRADFSTSDPELAPILDDYRIKLAK